MFRKNIKIGIMKFDLKETELFYEVKIVEEYSDEYKIKYLKPLTHNFHIGNKPNIVQKHNITNIVERNVSLYESIINY